MASNLESSSRPAATTLMQDISQQVTCSICLEHFNVPKTLPCLHNFCRDCLQETIQSSAHPKMPDPVKYPGSNAVFSFPCPSCRGEVEFPVTMHQPWSMQDVAKRAATSEFKTNFHIESQLDLLKKKLKQGCTEHQGETLLFYCKTCNKSICQLCLALNHTPPEHTITSVNRVAKEKRDGYVSKKDSVVKRKVELEKALKGCQRKLKDMQKVKNQCKKASLEVDTLNAVMVDFKKVMGKADHNLTTRVSRMINDNHTILNRIERCQKQSDELDQILGQSDQELLQQPVDERTSIHENLPQIPHVSPNSVSLQLEEGLVRICKSISDIKAQLKGICKQQTSTASDTSTQQPVVSSAQFSASFPSSSALNSSLHQAFSSANAAAISTMANPFAASPHQSSTSSSSSSSSQTKYMWTSSWPTGYPPGLPSGIRSVFPPPGLAHPSSRSQHHAQQAHRMPPNFIMPGVPGVVVVPPAGTSHRPPKGMLKISRGAASGGGASNNAERQQSQSASTSFANNNNALLPGNSNHHEDEEEDDDDEEEDYDYPEEEAMAYRDVWSDDNSDY